VGGAAAAAAAVSPAPARAAQGGKAAPAAAAAAAKAAAGKAAAGQEGTPALPTPESPSPASTADGERPTAAAAGQQVCAVAKPRSDLPGAGPLAPASSVAAPGVFALRCTQARSCSRCQCIPMQRLCRLLYRWLYCRRKMLSTTGRRRISGPRRRRDGRPWRWPPGCGRAGSTPYCCRCAARAPAVALLLACDLVRLTHVSYAMHGDRPAPSALAAGLKRRRMLLSSYASLPPPPIRHPISHRMKARA
jgi:hypothetical protein